MGASDYRECDACGCQVFYDGELDWTSAPDDAEGVIVGDEGGSLGHEVQDYRLGNLGAWCVLCRSCSATLRITVVGRSMPPPEEEELEVLTTLADTLANRIQELLERAGKDRIKGLVKHGR